MENRRIPLSPETHSRIDALARKISIACHLNTDEGELQAELRNHIEDKITAYLTGELKPSESDALLLAQTHFGNPATIQSLFAHTLPSATPLPPSTLRRLVTVSLATLILFPLLDFFGRLAFGYLVILPAIQHARQLKTAMSDLPLRMGDSAVTVLQMLALAVTLVLLRRREKHNVPAGPSSRLRQFLPYILAMASPATVSLLLYPGLRDMLPRLTAITSMRGTFHDLVLPTLAHALLAAQFVLWIWWVGPSRKKLIVFLATALAWIFTKALLNLPVAMQIAFINRNPAVVGVRVPGAPPWYRVLLLMYDHSFLTSCIPAMIVCLVLFAVLSTLHDLRQRFHRRQPNGT